MMKQPVKTSIQVDAILTAALQSMKRASQDLWPATTANGTMAALFEGLAEALLTEAQQKQLQTILTLWQECRNVKPQA